MMKNYEKETIDILKFKGKELRASFYRPRKKKIQATLLYFHGGGLIFGERDDLPEKYINLFAENGLALLAVDYPLAPETKMPAILQVAFEITDWFIEDFITTTACDNYFIMGRSAGGFLAMSSALHAKKNHTAPQGVISLYGYYNLNDAIFTVPNRYYLKYPKVNDTVLASLVKQGQVVTKGAKDRFLLYLASRQKGDWMDLLLSSNNDRRELSIPRDAIQKLPALFLAAANKDPDVPSRQSRQLEKLHPNAELTLYDLEEHDFDRTHQETFGVPTYQKMIRWIQNILAL